MILYIIRHAQSADNVFVEQASKDNTEFSDSVEAFDEREADTGLSDKGKNQVRRLAEYLSKFKENVFENPRKGYSDPNCFDFTHVYSSLMIRAMETAGGVAGATGITPGIWEDVHETGGVWRGDKETGELVGAEGNNRAFLEKRFPNCKLPDRLGDEGWWNRPLETNQEVKDRARRFYRELIEKHGATHDRVVVVSHGYFISFLFNALLKIPPKSKIRFHMNNTAITRVNFVNDLVHVVYQNRTDHLPRELVT